MISDPNILLVMAVAIALLVGSIGMAIFFYVQKRKQANAFDVQIAELLSSDFEDYGATEVTPMVRWNRYWDERFKVMGWSSYGSDGTRAGRDTILVFLFVVAVTTALFRNPLPGIVIGAVVLYLASIYMKTVGDKAADKINLQLPGFLFALKANVQANVTPERAILKVADNMPSPLYEDLMVVKQRILANATFHDAIQELGHKTKSRDLKFLCACMVQASSTGASLENQITVIQGVLDSRRKVSSEMNKAIRSATPAIWVATFVLPASFIALYFMNEAARDFWFVDPLSWAALVAVALLYVVGLWLSKKLVDSIKNL